MSDKNRAKDAEPRSCIQVFVGQARIHVRAQCRTAAAQPRERPIPSIVSWVLRTKLVSSRRWVRSTQTTLRPVFGQGRHRISICVARVRPQAAPGDLSSFIPGALRLPGLLAVSNHFERWSIARLQCLLAGFSIQATQQSLQLIHWDSKLLRHLFFAKPISPK